MKNRPDEKSDFWVPRVPLFLRGLRGEEQKGIRQIGRYKSRKLHLIFRGMKMNPRGYAQRYDRKSMDRIMLIYIEFGSLPSTFRMRERERERELNLLKTHTRRPMKLNEKNPNFKYRLRERERERETRKIRAWRL